MPKKLLFYFLFSFCTVSHGQIGGKYTYQFLNLVTSPRQAALGGKTITIYDEDVNQAQFNPATINPDMDNHLALNYGSYFGEVSYGTVSYAYTYDRHLQTFQVGVNYVNYGKIDGYDENGQETSQFTGSEVVLSFGYAYNVPNSNLFLGANGKLISSTLESYSSFGGAVDLGAIFIDDVNDVNWALVIRNIGTQFTTYNGINEKLPLEIMLGVSQELENVPVRWHLTFENLQQWNISFTNPNQAQTSLDGSTTEKKTSFLGNALRHTIFGVELFPKKAVNLRLGYNFRRAEELKVEEIRNFSGISATIALEYIKSNAELLGLKSEILSKFNIHLHVPEGATPKDGPSAGIAMLTSLVSVLTQKKIKKGLAMTGEITLRGKVLPVGGIKEKILAAKRANIKEIILCYENKSDIDEIKPKYIEGLTFHYVKEMSEVLKIAITDQKVKNAKTV